MPTFTRNFSQGILTGNFLLQGCFCSIFNGFNKLVLRRKNCGNSITISPQLHRLVERTTGLCLVTPVTNLISSNTFCSLKFTRAIWAFHGHFNETLLCLLSSTNHKYAATFLYCHKQLVIVTF